MTIDDVIPVGEFGPMIKFFSYAVTACLFIFMLYYLVTGNRFARISLTKNAWTGTYNDEFLNNVNLRAYKGAFFTIIILAGMCMFGLFAPLHFTTEIMSSMIIAISLFVYGLFIIFQLRESDE